jgi:radical SAM-linked protein
LTIEKPGLSGLLSFNRQSQIGNLKSQLGSMLGDKLRFRFAKTGALRLLSHHDLMRSIERMLRRADLPFKSTAGFHPTPRVHFALSLPLGVEGLDEVVEMEFTRELDAEETRLRLNSQAPDGLAFIRVSAIPSHTTAMPRRAVYRLALPTERIGATTSRSSELMSLSQVWVDRLRPSPKRLNIRPYFRSLAVHDGALALDLWVTPTGTARADELLKLLDLPDLPEAGAVVERLTVELHDEAPNLDAADVPPHGPAETLPLEPATRAALDRRDDDEVTAAAGWGASPAGPVVE